MRDRTLVEPWLEGSRCVSGERADCTLHGTFQRLPRGPGRRTRTDGVRGRSTPHALVRATSRAHGPEGGGGSSGACTGSGAADSY